MSVPNCIEDLTDEDIRRALGERHAKAIQNLKNGIVEDGDGLLFFEVLNYILANQRLH